MKLFIGTNYGHGSSAAVMSEEGKLLFAIEEGRIIGEKETSQFPKASLKIIFENTDGEFAGWAEGWDVSRRLIYKGIMQTVKYGILNPTYFNHRLKKEIKRYQQGQSFFENASTKQRIDRSDTVGHHLAHAYSLLASGLLPNSLIYVSDTTAEKKSVSSYYWSGKKMTSLSYSNYPHSIGSIYHQLAYHLGFSGRTGPGKVMALSAYGQPVWYENLSEICNIEQGRFVVDLKKYPAWKIDKTWLKFSKLQNDDNFEREIAGAYHNFENGKNLASSIQKWFTEMTFECILQSLKIARENHGFEVNQLGLSGGSALNCQANGEILRRIGKHGIHNVTISPWSDDAGTAIGAAAWMVHKNNPLVKLEGANPFLGLHAQANTNILENDIQNAVDALLEGQIIALISGRLEFGPRALGGRCLLAATNNTDTIEVLNKMKGRPSFMPFAPAVLTEDYDKFFEGEGSSIMAWTVYAKPNAKYHIPAAIHESGEARVMIVKNEAMMLHRVLKKYKKKAGFGVLLLTSLNGAGQAIPCTLQQSIQVAQKLGVGGILTDNKWVNNGETGNSKLVEQGKITAIKHITRHCT